MTKDTPSRHCYISRNYKDVNSAGGKAKTDIECIMQNMGFVNLGLKRTTHKNKIVDFLLTFSGVCMAMLRLRRGDVLVLQYPVKKYYTMLCRHAHRRGARVVTIIHDLGSFRRKKLTIPQEIKRLSDSDVVIAHNEKMMSWLKENGLQVRLTTLGIFDYLNREDAPEVGVDLTDNNGSDGRDLMFVGSMAPSQNRFIYDLGKRLQHTKMFLYGGAFDASLAPANGSLVAKGFARDMDLITGAQGNFGLSWYGDSLDFGSGKIGEYMAYNNPHKVSLYLRCGMPVILWKEAGLASFVEREGVGLCVDSLTDIEQTLSALDDTTIAAMRRNVARVAARIKAGKYFEEAFTNALLLLENPD
ncbi:MAG: galactofuranosyltransferase [Prevotella sp.]|nr:galactofuranosyltransferase [Prevotella sp.]